MTAFKAWPSQAGQIGNAAFPPTCRPLLRLERASGVGHEDAFPRPRLNAHCRFSQETFAGSQGNGDRLRHCSRPAVDRDPGGEGRHPPLVVAALEAAQGYDKTPGAIPSNERHRPDFGVRWPSDRRLPALGTRLPLSQKSTPWMQSPRLLRQTMRAQTGLRTHLSSGPAI